MCGDFGGRRGRRVRGERNELQLGDAEQRRRTEDAGNTTRCSRCRRACAASDRPTPRGRKPPERSIAACVLGVSVDRPARPMAGPASALSAQIRGNSVALSLRVEARSVSSVSSILGSRTAAYSAHHARIRPPRSLPFQARPGVPHGSSPSHRSGRGPGFWANRAGPVDARDTGNHSD